ncbi:MAG: UDP-2,3-diacylglucosamine diphosphatase LpxI [Vampirovibrionales bacterium]|nr:UDP-2,3-diacylglucosamine diphosphatase LpxI [Vampirovibrionales bacterium]
MMTITDTSSDSPALSDALVDAPENHYPQTLPNPQTTGPLGLIAGSGQLPVSVALQAKAWGWDVVAFCLDNENVKALEKAGARIEVISPGLMADNLARGHGHGIRYAAFAGKVNKWLLLRNPKLDAKALETLQKIRERSDDGMMLAIIQLMAAEGFEVLAQTEFLRTHFLPQGCLTKRGLTEVEWADVAYGFGLAKGMGALDVGQTVVVHQGMALAVEAIEGTDECLKRAGDLANKGWLKTFFNKKSGGVVVKVAKPNQDPRFDVPTVGLKTLKTMKEAGLKVLAAEAHRTFFLEPEAMVAYANRHEMSIVVTPEGQECSQPLVLPFNLATGLR